MGDYERVKRLALTEGDSGALAQLITESSRRDDEEVFRSAIESERIWDIQGQIPITRLLYHRLMRLGMQGVRNAAHIAYYHGVNPKDRMAALVAAMGPIVLDDRYLLWRLSNGAVVALPDEYRWPIARRGDLSGLLAEGVLSVFPVESVWVLDIEARRGPPFDYLNVSEDVFVAHMMVLEEYFGAAEGFTTVSTTPPSEEFIPEDMAAINWIRLESSLELIEAVDFAQDAFDVVNGHINERAAHILWSHMTEEERATYGDVDELRAALNAEAVPERHVDLYWSVYGDLRKDVSIWLTIPLYLAPFGDRVFALVQGVLWVQSTDDLDVDFPPYELGWGHALIQARTESEYQLGLLDFLVAEIDIRVADG